MFRLQSAFDFADGLNFTYYYLVCVAINIVNTEMVLLDAINSFDLILNDRGFYNVELVVEFVHERSFYLLGWLFVGEFVG